VLAPTATSRPATPSPFQLKPFDQLKRTLALPAAGKRLITYGERNKFGRKSEGLVIETRFGARITSPADGWIAYASPFRSLGQLLIISVGDGYYIVMAGLAQIDAQPGHFVSASEPVGTMGAAPKEGAKDNLPTLYIEFRKDNRTIDPDSWWATAEQKVQG
jgi:septal ring factor EnvC (AmiA/AmiB activator)